jgi:hypothetical protein
VFGNVPRGRVASRLRTFGDCQGRQGQDGIARDPYDHEGSLYRVWADRREDEHDEVESRQGNGGDNASTVSQDDQYLLLANAIIAWIAGNEVALSCTCVGGCTQTAVLRISYLFRRHQQQDRQGGRVEDEKDDDAGDPSAEHVEFVEAEPSVIGHVQRACVEERDCQARRC